MHEIMYLLEDGNYCVRNRVVPTIVFNLNFDTQMEQL